MKFTSELPTKAGYFLFKKYKYQSGCPVEVRIDNSGELVIHGWGVRIKNAGGLWCRLVPAEEVEKLIESSVEFALRCKHCKGNQQDNDGENYINQPCPECKDLWEALSRAKRVMEGLR